MVRFFLTSFDVNRGQRVKILPIFQNLQKVGVKITDDILQIYFLDFPVIYGKIKYCSLLLIIKNNFGPQ